MMIVLVVAVVMMTVPMVVVAMITVPMVVVVLAGEMGGVILVIMMIDMDEGHGAAVQVTDEVGAGAGATALGGAEIL